MDITTPYPYADAPRHTARNSSLYDDSRAFKLGDRRDACADVNTKNQKNAHATVLTAFELHSNHADTSPRPATSCCRWNPHTCMTLTRAYGRFGTPSAPAERRIHAAAGG